MNMNFIENYFASDIHKPFYMVVGNSEYKEIINNLQGRKVCILRISQYCRYEDKIPDLDWLKEELKGDKNIVLIGLGEYLALEGKDKARRVLAGFINYNLGNAHVVLLLRCVKEQVEELIKNDKRLKQEGRIVISDSLDSKISFDFAVSPLKIYPINGLKEVLKILEDGTSDKTAANTAIEFPNSLLQISYLRNFYDAIVKKVNIPIPKNYGSAEMWEKMFADLKKQKFDTVKLFNEYGFTEFQDADFYDLLYNNDEYKSWLFYISLVTNIKNYKDRYIGYVLDKSIGLSDFKDGILNAIIDISHDDNQFSKFYNDRKKLLLKYPDSNIAQFITNNRKNIDESIYKLTDNTLLEKQEIIYLLGKYGNHFKGNLNDIYPDLAAYQKDYYFVAEDEDSTILRITEYFKKYKKLKLEGRLTEDFLKEVDELACKRIYNLLPKRDELVQKENNGNTKLFWIDSLGVEYSGFISELARQKDLKISIDIGRADLPTTTEFNNNFFYNWPEKLRYSKENKLDELKHGELNRSQNINYQEECYPIYLAEELKIIKEAINVAAVTLNSHEFERIVIASDHGTSRLAVLCKREDKKYSTETKGERSGRCCPFYANCDIPFAIIEEEKKYIVLADYGRFKGSREAKVEVHGGASLEEVVVPVITLALNNDKYVIEAINKNKIVTSKSGIIIELYINKKIKDSLYLVYAGQKYLAEKTEKNNYTVHIKNITKSGKYVLDVYANNVRIGDIEIEVEPASVKMNDDFENFFKE